MPGVPWEKIWQQIRFDRRERAERLQVSNASTIAFRLDSARSCDALIRNQHMPQLSAKTVFPLHDAPIENDPASISRPDDDRNRCLPAVCAKDGIVSPKRGGIRIVQIRHRFAELL